MTKPEFTLKEENGVLVLKCPTEKDDKGNIKVHVPKLSLIKKILKENGKRNIQ